MTATPAIAKFRPVLEDEDLLSPVLFDDSCFDSCAGYRRPAHLHSVTVGQQQDIRQFDLITDFIGQFFNREGMALFGAVLPATTFNNCVHVNLQKEPASVLMPAAVIMTGCSTLPAGVVGYPLGANSYYMYFDSGCQSELACSQVIGEKWTNSRLIYPMGAING
jgi:hypothetical protein